MADPKISNQMLTGLPLRAKTVTPDDNTNLRGYGGDDDLIAATIYAGEAGTVRVIPFVDDGSNSTVDVTVVAGGIIPFRVKRVLDTGTDDIELTAIW